MQSVIPPRRRGVPVRTPVAALLALLAAPGAFAQATPEPETVVVSATRSNLTADDAPLAARRIGMPGREAGHG
jgi:hypothetical protein